MRNFITGWTNLFLSIRKIPYFPIFLGLRVQKMAVTLCSRAPGGSNWLVCSSLISWSPWGSSVSLISIPGRSWRTDWWQLLVRWHSTACPAHNEGGRNVYNERYGLALSSSRPLPWHLQTFPIGPTFPLPFSIGWRVGVSEWWKSNNDLSFFSSRFNPRPLVVATFFIMIYEIAVQETL